VTIDALTPGGSAPTVGLLALLVGICALMVAAGWRFVRLLRVRRGVASGLRDPDAAVRTAAVHQAAEMGLASTASALLRAVRAESDPGVLASVVRTVASRQWEPASTAGIVELRLWARAYAERHPEVRRPATAAPLLAGVAGTVPPPSLDPSRAAEFRTRQDQVPDLPAAEPAAPAHDEDRMGPVRVVVTGAGGPAGIAVIRALRSRGHHVLALDADPSAAGLRLADAHHVVPRADAPDYLAVLLHAATVADAQALICTVAEEYVALGRAESYLREAGLRTLMPSVASVDACIDKWAFFQLMIGAGLPTPATGLATAEGVPGPWIVKPRFGRGSRDVWACTTRQQLAAALRRVPDPIVQTQLAGREFTCDALVERSGAVAGAAARWRTETRGGISTKGTTFEDPEVTDLVTRALKTVELVGPANVQGFVSDDGTVTVHEINPRFSGGLPLSLAAGADLVEEYLRDVMGLPVRPTRLVARTGVTMTRYFCEVFEG